MDQQQSWVVDLVIINFLVMGIIFLFQFAIGICRKVYRLIVSKFMEERQDRLTGRVRVPGKSISFSKYRKTKFYRLPSDERRFKSERFREIVGQVPLHLENQAFERRLTQMYTKFFDDHQDRPALAIDSGKRRVRFSCTQTVFYHLTFDDKHAKAVHIGEIMNRAEASYDERDLEDQFEEELGESKSLMQQSLAFRMTTSGKQYPGTNPYKTPAGESRSLLEQGRISWMTAAAAASGKHDLCSDPYKDLKLASRSMIPGTIVGEKLCGIREVPVLPKAPATVLLLAPVPFEATLEKVGDDSSFEGGGTNIEDEDSILLETGTTNEEEAASSGWMASLEASLRLATRGLGAGTTRTGRRFSHRLCNDSDVGPETSSSDEAEAENRPRRQTSTTGRRKKSTLAASGLGSGTTGSGRRFSRRLAQKV